MSINITYNMETSLNYTSSETENYVKSFTTNDSNLVVKKHYIKYIFFDKKHVESFIYDLVNKPDYYEIIEKNENSVVIMNDTYDTTFTIDLNKFILERTKIQYIESDKIKGKKKEYVNFPIGKFNFITEDLKEKFAYINQKLYLKEINYGNSTINKGRPDKEEIDHYIDIIFKVIKNGIPWKSLNEKLHFSTYHKKFVKWNNLNLFENIHKIIIKLLYNKNLLLNNNKDLFIDTTMIKNINGSEYIGPNHYDRNKNGNKISIIVTKTGIPLGLKLAPSNIHDINLVEDTIDNISIKIIGSIIGADKGYISNNLKKN